MSKLSNFFFEDDGKDSSPKQPERKSINSTPTPLSTTVFQQPSYTPSITPIPQDMDKFIAHFNELFDKSNQPGPDYYKFTKMVQALNVPGMDDTTKMNAAFAALKVQGLTKDVLIQTAQNFITMIDNDYNTFNAAVDGKVKGDIEAKKQSLKDMQADIVKKQELINQLQQDIIKETTDITNASADIADQEKKEIIDSYGSYFLLSESMDKFPCELSGGQRQRVSILQQVLAGNKFILMDEPFSGLDLVMKDKVIDLLLKIANLNEYNTLVIVSHDIESACAISDTVHVLGNPDGNGSTVIKTYDFLQEGLAYEPGIRDIPRFREIIKEIKSIF